MSNLLDDINRARNGDIVTIPFIHPILKKYIFLGRDLYHLIGGAGGSGKSAWVDYNYAIFPTHWYKTQGYKEDIKLKVIIRSMERAKKHRIAKWVCMRMYQRFGVLIDTNSLLGWGSQKSKITDELFEQIKLCYQEIEALEDTIEVIDGIENPTGIYKQLVAEALGKGTLYRYENINNREQLVKLRGTSREIVPPQACKKATKYQPIYIPDDPKEVTIFIVDHLQAMKRESGFTAKENLDKMSEYARIMRDLYGFTPIIVNQLNRNISDTFRKVKTDLLPQDSDFSGSSNMFNDCDVAGILFNPYKYNLSNLLKWDIRGCVDSHGINRFRSFHLLKNSYGPDNQIFGYQFIGENGIFNELPSEVNDYQPIAYPKNKQKITNYT